MRAIKNLLVLVIIVAVLGHLPDPEALQAFVGGPAEPAELGVQVIQRGVAHRVGPPQVRVVDRQLRVVGGVELDLALFSLAAVGGLEMAHMSRDAVTSDCASSPSLALHLMPFSSVTSKPGLKPVLLRETNVKRPSALGTCSSPPAPQKRSRVARSSGSLQNSAITSALGSPPAGGWMGVWRMVHAGPASSGMKAKGRRRRRRFVTPPA